MFVLFCPGPFGEGGRGCFDSGYETQNQTALSKTVSYREVGGREGDPPNETINKILGFSIHSVIGSSPPAARMVNGGAPTGLGSGAEECPGIGGCV